MRLSPRNSNNPLRASAVVLGYVLGACSRPALHPMICEDETIKLENSSHYFHVLNCDESFLGYSGIPDVRNAKCMGCRECYVANDEQ